MAREIQFQLCNLQAKGILQVIRCPCIVLIVVSALAIVVASVLCVQFIVTHTQLQNICSEVDALKAVSDVGTGTCPIPVTHSVPDTTPANDQSTTPTAPGSVPEDEACFLSIYDLCDNYTRLTGQQH